MRGKRSPTTVTEVADRDPVDEAAEQEQLAAGLQHLRDLLERARVEEARRYVKELEQRWPEAERVRHYAHVLAPPKVRLRPDIPARSREREWKWLEEHGHEYPGCWLAIYEDRLISADPDRRVVTTRATEVLGEESYLLFHQPSSPETK
jgi:hypothetical protein